MTLLEIIERIKAIAAEQPIIHSIVENDVYRLNAIPDVRYSCFGITQGTHRVELSGMGHYQFYLYYIDRLTESVDNETECVSVGAQVLANIVFTLESMGVWCEDYDVQPFIQKFADQCAGCYAILTVNAPVSQCADFYTMADYNEDYNKDYLSNIDIY